MFAHCRRILLSWRLISSRAARRHPLGADRRRALGRGPGTCGWSNGLILSLSLVCLGLSAGCAPKRVSGLTESPEVSALRPEVANLKAQADEAWLGREDPERLLEAILTYKRVAQADPRNREVLVRLSRALYFMADAYLPNEEEKLARYDQGAYYGEKALALNPRFKAELTAGKPLEEAVAVLSVEDCEAAYWTAANLGKWAKLKGPSTVLRNTARFKALLEKADALDDQYHYAATSRTWGAFYAAMPAFAGGDLKRSREYFDKALRIAPQFFTIKVLMAEMYAPKAKDRALFESLLRAVIDADPTVLPNVIPEQKAEQRKARDLLAREAEFFPE